VTTSQRIPVLRVPAQAFYALARERGWTTSERPTQYGLQLRATRAGQIVSLSVFSTGRALVQGRESELRTTVQK